MPSKREQFRKVADEMLIPVAEFDLDYKLLYMNEAAFKLLQMDKAALKAGAYVDDFLAPEQIALVHEGLKRLKEGAEPTSMLLRVLRKDKAKVPTEVFTQIATEDGQPVSFVAYIFDLSRREAIEEKARERKEILNFLVDYSSFSGFAIINDKYQIEYANDKLLDIVGRTRSEFLNHNFREFLHPDSLELVTERYVKRRRGEDVPSIYEVKMLKKDGTPRDLRMNVGLIRSRDGSLKTVVHVVDITEMKANQRELEASERRYRTLIETMDSGLAVDRENGKMVMANEALARMLGYESAEELINRPETDIVYGWTKNDVNGKIANRKEGKFEHYEASLKKKTDELIPVVISASPLFSPGGEYEGSFAIFTDVSELKNAENEVRFLLDLLLHDIGNQLQLVLAGGGFLAADANPAMIIKAKEYVMDGANRCLDMIATVRKSEESKAEPVRPIDIIEVLKAEIQLLSRQYNIEPKVGEIPEQAMIRADSALSHMIWNLMENAIKHNPKKKKQIWINGKSTRKSFALSIADNGPGLENGMKVQLFDPRRRYGGVGLHLVHRLAEKYGAKVKVDNRVKSQSEKGLKVTVTFQLAG